MLTSRGTRARLVTRPGSEPPRTRSIRPELAAEQLDKAGALSLGELDDPLAWAEAGEAEQPARIGRADLRHGDEQVEYLGAGEVAGPGGEDLLEADRALTQILLEFRPRASNLVSVPERDHPALERAG